MKKTAKLNRQLVSFLFLFLAVVIGTTIAYHALKWPFVLYRKAEIKFSEKEYTEAIELYKHAIEGGVTIPRLYQSLANSYMAVGDFPEATKWFKHYLAVYPDDWQTVIMAARSLSYAGRYDEALELYKQLNRSHRDVAIPQIHGG